MNAHRSVVVKKLHVFILTGVLSIVFAIGGYYYYRYQEDEARRKNHQLLSTIGEMKAEHLAYWYEDELYDAAVFARNPLLIRYVEEWLLGGNLTDRSNLIDLLDLTKDSHSYENIMVTDPHGEVLLSFKPDIAEVDSIVVDYIERAVTERDIISTDLYKSALHDQVYIDFLAPIISERDEPLAVLVLRMDPDEYLYPFIKSWPTPSETAETFLVRKENDSVVFLNDLRHKDGIALNLRYSLNDTELPAVKAVLGYAGLFEGRDYRGVDVLTDIRNIPETPWYVVSKIDRSEVYSEIYIRAGVIIAFVCLLTLLLGTGLAFIYSNLQRIIYRALYSKEKELWESQEEFKTTLYSIGDAVITTDTTGNIRNMNPTAEKLTGWVEPDAQGNPIVDVFKIINEETRNSVDNPVQKVLQEGRVVGIANHTILISKEGKEIPIADSGAPIRNEAGEIIGVVLVFRDQTAEREAANKLRESERRLSTLMSNLPGMAYRCRNDPQWTMEFVSDGCVDLTGYARDNLIESKVIAYADLIHPDDRQMVWDEIQHALNSNRSFKIIYRIQTAGDNEKWVWAQGRGIYSEDGDLAALEGFITDITDRKRMEDRLLLQATALEAAANAIVITNRDGIIEWVNPEFTHNTGYPLEEAVGEHTRLLKSGVHDQAFYKELWDTVFSGNVWRGEMTNRRKDGSLYTEEQTITPVKNEVGEVTHFIAIKQDITERKQGEESLRRREQQFRLIAENVPDMIVVLDTEGRRLYSSPSFEPILGDPDALVGTDSFKDIHPDDRERIRQVFKETIRTGIGQHAEYRIMAKDGTIRIIESKGGVIRDDEGNATQVVVVSRDVTEKRKFERQLLRTQRMESIGTLAGGIAHDLNNVLSPILLAVQVIKKRTSEKKAEKFLDTIEISAKRGIDLVNQVLSFARGIEGERKAIEIGKLIDDVSDVIKRTIPKSISVNIDTQKDVWTLSGNATQVHQILMNLCINARDAMPEGGKLEIKASNIVIDEQYARMNLDATPGSFVKISVSDMGTGIPESVIDKIFEPFFTTKEEGKGTGLGLSTVHTIAKSHGGFLNVYSEEGKGTVFNIYLPATEIEVETIVKDKKEIPTGNGELILVVDDEKSVRAITQATLEANGYSVLTAADGIEAVTTYTAHIRDIALVLMDLWMPNMDGHAAIRTIKQMNPKAKCIAMSGMVKDGKSVKQDFVWLLHKPFTSETLLSSIYNMLLTKK